jgi:hypothetical protein
MGFLILFAYLFLIAGFLFFVGKALLQMLERKKTDRAQSDG